MDIDTIEPGTDFTTAIDEAVTRADALLVVIGKNWTSVTDDDGRRRLDNPKDFVGREISAALQRGVRVIPLLVRGARMPSAEELPGELKALSSRQAVEISDTRFDYDVDRLMATFKGHRRKIPPGVVIAASLIALGLVVAGAVRWLSDAPRNDGERRRVETDVSTPDARTDSHPQLVARPDLLATEPAALVSPPLTVTVSMLKSDWDDYQKRVSILEAKYSALENDRRRALERIERLSEENAALRTKAGEGVERDFDELRRHLATVEPGRVRFAWPPSSLGSDSKAQAAGYRVHIDGQSYDVGNVTTYTLVLPPGRHTVALSVYDTRGFESPRSNQELVIVPP
jgi:hypothetical protein